MSITRKILRTVLTLVGYMIVADIAGVILGFVIDILPIRAHNGPVGWAIWFVMGVFVGLLAYNSVGEAITPGSEFDWTARPGGRQAGLLIVIVGSVVIGGVYEACNFLLWKKGIEGDAYVPDSPTFTVLFLATIWFSMLGSLLFIRPLKPNVPEAPSVEP